MREIILDTETTGLDPGQGHRLVEIGCVELLNSVPTGKTFHKYLNPLRDMPEEAFRVHGLSLEFLSDKPLFADIVGGFTDFIGDARLVIHNAEFDMRFINAELARIEKPVISMERVLDTLMLARRKHPGMPNSLDALCNRYHIDNSRRTKHGALLDAEILAEVYIELTGGHQKAFALGRADTPALKKNTSPVVGRQERLLPLLTRAEAEAHLQFTEEMGQKSVWQLYLPSKPPIAN